jgi:hypothetical protein
VNSEKKFVLIALVVAVAAFGGIVLFAGQGNVRHVNIFFPEEIRQTLEFRNIDGKTVVVGTIGNSGTNPDLISRTEFAYILTIKNADTKPHLFYVDQIGIKTKLLEPGQEDTILIQSKKEAIFRYYDIAETKQFLGTIQIKRVTLTE